jgi:hypothetical protein
MLPPGPVAAPSVIAALDRRDVPSGDTALHLAVRLQLSSLVSALTTAGRTPTAEPHRGVPHSRRRCAWGAGTSSAAALRRRGGAGERRQLQLPAARRGGRAARDRSALEMFLFTLIAAFLFPMLQSLFRDVAISVCKCCMNVLDHVAIIF